MALSRSYARSRILFSALCYSKLDETCGQSVSEMGLTDLIFEIDGVRDRSVAPQRDFLKLEYRLAKHEGA